MFEIGLVTLAGLLLVVAGGLLKVVRDLKQKTMRDLFSAMHLAQSTLRTLVAVCTCLMLTAIIICMCAYIIYAQNSEIARQKQMLEESEATQGIMLKTIEAQWDIIAEERRKNALLRKP